MQQFVNNTKNDKALIDLLKKSNWYTYNLVRTFNYRDVNQAVDEYFTRGLGEKASGSKT